MLAVFIWFHALFLTALCCADLMTQSGDWRHCRHSNCPQEVIYSFKETIFFLCLSVSDMTYLLLSWSGREGGLTT